jgi:hypothetical protein
MCQLVVGCLQDTAIGVLLAGPFAAEVLLSWTIKGFIGALIGAAGRADLLTHPERARATRGYSRCRRQQWPQAANGRLGRLREGNSVPRNAARTDMQF